MVARANRGRPSRSWRRLHDKLRTRSPIGKIASLVERQVASGPHLIATPYDREEAGTHRYNVGTDTPKLRATSCGGVRLANSFLAA